MWRASILYVIIPFNDFLFLKTQQAYKLDWPFLDSFSLLSKLSDLCPQPIAIQLTSSLILTINGRFHLYFFLPHLWYGRISAHEWELRGPQHDKLESTVYHCMRCVIPHCIFDFFIIIVPLFLCVDQNILLILLSSASQKHTCHSIIVITMIFITQYWAFTIGILLIHSGQLQQRFLTSSFKLPSRSLSVSHITFQLVKIVFSFFPVLS